MNTNELNQADFDQRLANSLAEKLALKIGLPSARELCRVMRENRITDPIHEDNSIGPEVVKMIRNAFQEIRAHERRLSEASSPKD